MQQLANAQGVITVTALDHRGSLKQNLQRAMPDRTIGCAEQEAMTLVSAEEREQALCSTAPSRLDILNALANHRARPWYARFPCQQ
jgi:hypothetical protein